MSSTTTREAIPEYRDHVEQTSISICATFGRDSRNFGADLPTIIDRYVPQCPTRLIGLSVKRSYLSFISREKGHAGLARTNSK